MPGALQKYRNTQWLTDPINQIRAFENFKIMLQFWIQIYWKGEKWANDCVVLSHLPGQITTITQKFNTIQFAEFLFLML